MKDKAKLNEVYRPTGAPALAPTPAKPAHFS